MSVPGMPQTKDSRNSGEGPPLSAERKAASRKAHTAGLANAGTHWVLESEDSFSG